MNVSPLDGIWRLVQARASDQHGQPLPPPYGLEPLGMVQIQNGRMLAALCNGDASLASEQAREFVSYGGPCGFDGKRLSTDVELSARADWLGAPQVREAELEGIAWCSSPATRVWRRAAAA